MDNPTQNNKQRPPDLRAVEEERWEGEGGHPPVARSEEKLPKVTDILRKLLINLRSK
jgi:hypothetical protein